MGRQRSWEIGESEGSGLVAFCALAWKGLRSSLEGPGANYHFYSSSSPNSQILYFKYKF